MNLITLDMETYYDKEYSLSKMTTEEYIRDQRFEVIGVGVKVNNGQTEWASGTHEELKAYLDEFPWEDAMLLCQNTAFDAAILSWIFDIHPKALADTMAMSKAMDGVHVSASLKAQTERHLAGHAKGTEVIQAMGLRREDFSESALAAYGDYCVNDVELTYKLFRHYVSEGFPKKEMKVVDATLRMYSEPELELDAERLDTHIKNVRANQQEVLDKGGVDKSVLMSNLKFADMLREHGVEPPLKISKTTGKETFAFAKTDKAFQALQEHPNPDVQALVTARLGSKGTLEETRTARFVGIAMRGALPGPVGYYGAHTGRWSGFDKINLQNLPSRGRYGKILKKCIRAPKGYVIIEADLSQIEARLVAWLSGQDDLVQAFARGEDVYKAMASVIYNVPIEQVTDLQRFIGKGVILGAGYGMGAPKFRDQMIAQTGGEVVLPLEEASSIIRIYRSKYPRIKKLWYEANDTIKGLEAGYNSPYGREGVMRPDHQNNRIWMPNGLSLIYPDVHVSEITDKGPQYAYKSRKGVEKIYGGLLTENTCQALAKLIIAEHIVLINKRYRVKLTVHDSVIALARKEEAMDACQYIYECMHYTPDWAAGLPLDCELGFHEYYGSCDDNAKEVTAQCAATYWEAA